MVLPRLLLALLAPASSIPSPLPTQRALQLVAPPVPAFAAPHINMGATAMSNDTVLRSSFGPLGNAVEAAVVKRAGAEQTTLTILKRVHQQDCSRRNAG